MTPKNRKDAAPVPKTAAAGSAPEAPGADAQRSGGVMSGLGEWFYALTTAFLLAMFFRVFILEMFKIPSGSMTPTLLGTEKPSHAVAFVDVDDDGDEDMVLKAGGSYDVYLSNGSTYEYNGIRRPDAAERSRWLAHAKPRQDRIIVGKFFYWFSRPDRGDIAVFKPPRPVFDERTPIYIKRVVGLPGEAISFEPAPGVPGHERTMGYLKIDGQRVDAPAFFRNHLYEYRDLRDPESYPWPSAAEYISRPGYRDLVTARVDDDSVYLFGDNTVSSLDSRYWGGVPTNRLRGQAILRINRDPGFLH